MARSSSSILCDTSAESWNTSFTRRTSVCRSRSATSAASRAGSGSYSVGAKWCTFHWHVRRMPDVGGDGTQTPPRRRPCGCRPCKVHTADPPSRSRIWRRTMPRVKNATWCRVPSVVYSSCTPPTMIHPCNRKRTFPLFRPILCAVFDVSITGLNLNRIL